MISWKKELLKLPHALRDWWDNTPPTSDQGDSPASDQVNSPALLQVLWQGPTIDVPGGRILERTAKLHFQLHQPVAWNLTACATHVGANIE